MAEKKDMTLTSVKVKSDLFDYGIYDKPATQSITEFKDLLIKKKREI